MSIDEKPLVGATAKSSQPRPSQHSEDIEHEAPEFISTWPLTEEELDEIERDLKNETSTRRGNYTPAAIEEWPDWLQKQWIVAQRRRAWQIEHPSTFGRRVLSPGGVLVISIVLLFALVSFGLGAALSNGGSAAGSTPANTSHTSSTTSHSSGASGADNQQKPANVPDATQQYGNQPAKYTLDKDGAKHFTMTAQQVMWQPIKGHKVLAWTLDGTVPGPMLRATTGDHVRITIVNHLPEATTIHWHGLEVPSEDDGVPSLGMKPIEPGQSYTYDFTIRDQDAGTHWYHSHFDDHTQMSGGLYGAFLIAPRPGSPQYQPIMNADRADVDQTLFVGMLGSYYVINGKSFPETQPVIVKHGQTVHLRLIGSDTQMIHPMHLHGHSFQIVAEDGHLVPAPITRDTVSVAPGESYDISFYAWADPGSVYPLHCHISSHLMNPGQTGGEMGGLLMMVKYEK